MLHQVKKLLPNLHIFNSRLVDKIVGKEVHEEAGDFSFEAKIDQSMRDKNSSKAHALSGSKDNHLSEDSINKKRDLQDEEDVDSAENTNISEKRMKKKLKLQQNESRIADSAGTLDGKHGEVKKLKDNKRKRNQLAEEPDVNVATGKESDTKSREKNKGDKVNIFDSAEIPFTDLFATNAPEVPLETADKKLGNRTDQDMNAIHGLVTLATKKKKRNRVVDPAALELSQVNEIGLGGPSAWD